MRRIFFGTSTMALSLATLMWAAAPANGGRGHGGGHASGGGHAPAHVGSVHYASRPAPARVAPVRTAPVHAAPIRTAPVHVAPARVTHPDVRTGSVRSEHYAGSPSRGGAYRNPYRDDYFRHFRPGYRPFYIGDAQYYGYDDLPAGYEVVVIDGITYYVFDGVYYQAYISDGQTVYVAVPTQ